MQVIYKNKDKGYSSRRAGVIGLIVYVGRIGRYLERKCDGKFGK